MNTPCEFCGELDTYTIKDWMSMSYCYCSFVAQIESRELQRINKLLEDRIELLESMRPESYKSVADTADLRIVTTRNILKLINGELPSKTPGAEFPSQEFRDKSNGE